MFIFRRFSCRNNTGAILTFCMDNDNHSPLQSNECDKTLLSIIVAIALSRYNIAVKNGWNIGKIYSVLTID